MSTDKRSKALRFVSASALLMLSCGCLRAQGVEPHGRPEFAFAIHVVTPSGAADYADFVKDLLGAVNRQCFTKIPQSLVGDKEKLVIRLSIQKDGTLASQPTIEESSGEKDLDNAVVEAIRSAAPFDHLPSAFDGSSIELRLAFAYRFVEPRWAAGPVSCFFESFQPDYFPRRTPDKKTAELTPLSAFC